MPLWTAFTRRDAAPSTRPSLGGKGRKAGGVGRGMVENGEDKTGWNVSLRCTRGRRMRSNRLGRLGSRYGDGRRRERSTLPPDTPNAWPTWSRDLPLLIGCVQLSTTDFAFSLLRSPPASFCRSFAASSYIFRALFHLRLPLADVGGVDGAAVAALTALERRRALPVRVAFPNAFQSPWTAPSTLTATTP